MIKRLVAALGLSMCLCFTVVANEELSIKLKYKDSVYCKELGFANLNFKYLYAYGNNARVMVTIENITGNPPLAVLMFKNDRTEQVLKDGKPKIEFEKTYPGKKGSRTVRGCPYCNHQIDIIPAAVTDTVFTIDVPFTSSKDFTLSLYQAKYKANKLFKKGRYNINYKIIEKHLYDVHIEVVGWSVEDSTYVETKKVVDGFISSLDGVRFCYNKKHYPSLKAQQRPYQEKKDSLTRVISNILETHYTWMSTDAPHRAYSLLLSMLNKVNLDNMTYDCGEHKVDHRCSFCSMSAQEIYQRLDDLYQKLYAGKITKAQALKTAKGLYNCYQQNRKRKKDSSYVTKISRFYNSIANY